MSQDILANAKLDVLNVFDSIHNLYYNITDEVIENRRDIFGITNMTEMKMLIETRPRYPSNKLTFTIANIMKGITSRVLNIILLNLNGGFDVDVVLEDSQRNFLSSLFLWVSFY